MCSHKQLYIALKLKNSDKCNCTERLLFLLVIFSWIVFRSVDSWKLQLHPSATFWTNAHEYNRKAYWRATSSRHFLKQFNLTWNVTALSHVVPLLSMTIHLLDICLKYLEEWCACAGLKGGNCLHRKSTCCVITVPILATFQKEWNHALKTS